MPLSINLHRVSRILKVTLWQSCGRGFSYFQRINYTEPYVHVQFMCVPTLSSNFSRNYQFSLERIKVQILKQQYYIRTARSYYFPKPEYTWLTIVHSTSIIKYSIEPAEPKSRYKFSEFGPPQPPCLLPAILPPLALKTRQTWPISTSQVELWNELLAYVPSQLAGLAGGHLKRCLRPFALIKIAKCPTESLISLSFTWVFKVVFIVDRWKSEFSICYDITSNMHWAF